MKTTRVLAVVLLLVAATAMATDVVVGCGGFVHASERVQGAKPQNTDFSFVKVHLYNLDMQVKDTTECAPHGYYFLPIYEPGEFYIGVASSEGWSYAPEAIRVHITEDHKCKRVEDKSGSASGNKDEDDDINFELTGFAVEGRVADGMSSEGAQGVVVALTTSKGGETQEDEEEEEVVEVARTESDSKGEYAFGNVAPGEYRVRASHPRWTLAGQGSQTVRVTWGNAKVEEAFMVSGYDIEGRVESDGNGVAGVSMCLYSNEEDEAAAAAAAQQMQCGNDGGKSNPAPVPQGETSAPLCVAITDKEGRFQLSGVPSGAYRIVPYYQQAHTAFEVHPAVAKVLVQAASARVAAPFRVMGFSATGRVLDADGKGVHGVTVSVSSTKGQSSTTTTDAQGQYTLKRLVSGQYSLEATQDNTQFQRIEGHRLSANQPRLPDIHVAKYRLCGQIVLDSSKSGGNKQQQQQQQQQQQGTQKKEQRKFPVAGRSVVLQSDAAGAGAPVSTKTGADGSYCFWVAPQSSYKVSPVVSATERSQGFVLTPTPRVVAMASAPVLNANFYESRVTVSGRVKCIERPCDPSISVRLSATHRAWRTISGLGMGVGMGVSAGGDAQPDEDYFVFRDVLPGSYTLEIYQPSWCWAKGSLDIEVTSEDKSDVEFVQSGYMVRASLSHALQLTFVQQKGGDDSKVVQLSRGDNQQLCLDRPGVYEVSVDSCYRFGDTERWQVDTSAPKPLALTATHFRVQGQLKLGDKAEEQPESVEVEVIRSLKEEEVTVVKATRRQEEANTYTFAYYGRKGERVQVRPRATGELLFYPQSREVEIAQAECPPAMEAFEGRQGLFLAGRVTPALAGVKVSVRGDGQGTMGEVETDAAGEYRLGPLYDNQKYTVEAHKDGYKLSREDGSQVNFVAKKLGQIDVRVEAQGGDEAPGSVLLSLSGQRYRKNAASDEEGRMSFMNLAPGTYYLKPLQKEYRFEPSTYTVTLSEGETKEVVVTGTRVAYSVFGNVHSLTGKAMRKVSVEAVPQQGSADGYEEAVSDGEGKFRLRGLQPGVTYDVRVKANKDGVERASPATRALTMGNKDVRDVRFVVFPQPARFSVWGVVNVTREHQDKVSVGLWKEGRRVASTLLRPTRYFEFAQLVQGEYELRVETVLPKSVWTVDAPHTRVQVTDASVQADLRFHASVTRGAGGKSEGSFLGFFFVVAVVIGYLNRELIMQWINPETESTEGEWLRGVVPQERKGGKKRR